MKKTFTQQLLKSNVSVGALSVFFAAMSHISLQTVILHNNGRKKTQRKVQICNGLWQTRRLVRSVKNSLKKTKVVITCHVGHVLISSAGFALTIGRIMDKQQGDTINAINLRNYRKKKAFKLNKRKLKTQNTNLLGICFILNAMIITKKLKNMHEICYQRLKTK